MTPADLRTARKALGYTQHELAEALRMGAHGWQTISAWENGKRGIPGPVQIALQCLLEHKERTNEYQRNDIR
jgi:transcriptional regulator with XRE-family HTH domain